MKKISTIEETKKILDKLNVSENIQRIIMFSVPQYIKKSEASELLSQNQLLKYKKNLDKDTPYH